MNYEVYLLALAAMLIAFGVGIFETRRRHRKAQHPPTVIREPHVDQPLSHIHILSVGRSSIHKLTEGVSMRCCVAGCEEPFYMDGKTVDWMRDWLNATRVDSVKVQAIR